MANAKDIVKKQATMICDDVNDKGIITGLEQLGLVNIL